MTLAATLAVRAASRPASARYQIETLDDFESLLRLEPIWNEVVEQSGIPFPFATHELQFVFRQGLRSRLLRRARFRMAPALHGAERSA